MSRPIAVVSQKSNTKKRYGLPQRLPADCAYIPAAAPNAERLSVIFQPKDSAIPVINLSLVECSVGLTNEWGSVLIQPKSMMVTCSVSGVDEEVVRLDVALDHYQRLVRYLGCQPRGISGPVLKSL